MHQFCQLQNSNRFSTFQNHHKKTKPLHTLLPFTTAKRRKPYQNVYIIRPLPLLLPLSFSILFLFSVTVLYLSSQDTWISLSWIFLYYNKRFWINAVVGSKRSFRRRPAVASQPASQRLVEHVQHHIWSHCWQCIDTPLSYCSTLGACLLWLCWSCCEYFVVNPPMINSPLSSPCPSHRHSL